MDFFNEMWLKVGEHEYIYIFEIEFVKKIFCLKMVAKTSFVTRAIMLIYANYRENGVADMIFFPPKDALLIFRQLQKEGKIFYPIKQEARKRNVGSKWTPLMQLSVKEVIWFVQKRKREI